MHFTQEKKKNNFKNRKKGPNRPNRKNHRQNKKGRVSKLDPEKLIREGFAKEEIKFVSDRRIEDLPVHQSLISRLLKRGFERPTEIQDKTLEAGIDGRDILGIAQTGTGKTGAFLMPIINELLENPSQRNHALILVPTRELALQVEEEFKSMTKGLRLFSACFIGGTNINKDLQALKKVNHLVIGTPGRLLDLHGRKAIHFNRFNVLVLDEFDRMLDMGFSHDVDRIIGAMNNREQTMLFSATIDPAQKKQVANILTDPYTVKVSQGDTTSDHIEQNVIRLQAGEDKFKKLFTLLQQENFSKVLIFDETKHRVKRLSQRLNNMGIKSGQIQGNMGQGARQNALRDFKRGKTRVLVASDVASRGIDVNDISHVINYQLPMNYETYIHRIGRTGRAGRKGTALTFIS